MAKTIQTEESVADYLNSIVNDKKRKDCNAVIDIINKETGLEPKMWGSSIVGFGSYHYKYESGHEGNAPLTGLAARSNAITLYLVPEFEQKDDLLLKFGKHKTGKGCIYFQKLEDVDTEILKKLVNNSVQQIKRLYPS